MHSAAVFPVFLPGLSLPSAAEFWHRILLALRDLAGLAWHNVGAGQRPLRTEVIRSTLLGDASRLLHWREAECIELPWDGAECLIERAWQSLRACGFEDTVQAAVAVSGLPARPLHCRAQPFAEKPAEGEDAEGTESPSPGDATVQPACFALDEAEFLRRALILGRCNEHFYDPAKPVLWTRKRLARRIRLYQTGGFYHEDR